MIGQTLGRTARATSRVPAIAALDIRQAQIRRWAHAALGVCAGTVRSAGITLLLLLVACATNVHLTPTLPGTPNLDCRVLGHVSHLGNPEYLPSVLVDDPRRPADAVLHYVHEASYGLTELPSGIQVVNPLHLVGFPTGERTVSISGRLDVIRGGTVVRSFAAVAAMERAQVMFSEGETFTEMRRRGLLLVRDNIAAQVCADSPATQALLDAPPALVNAPETP